MLSIQQGYTMSNERATFQHIADYFAPSYDLYERAGVRYPVVVFPPDPTRAVDLDSVLADNIPNDFEDPATFALRDERHLAAWETQQRSAVFAPIESDEALLGALPTDVRGELCAHMGPHASAALWLGVDRTRAVVGKKD
jgi:hypothetical protein